MGLSAVGDPPALLSRPEPSCLLSRDCKGKKRERSRSQEVTKTHHSGSMFKVLTSDIWRIFASVYTRWWSKRVLAKQRHLNVIIKVGGSVANPWWLIWFLALDSWQLAILDHVSEASQLKERSLGDLLWSGGYSHFAHSQQHYSACWHAFRLPAELPSL